MNRNDLIELALIRLRESLALLESGNYEGAYYLCGYVVECGLKACIANNTRRHDFPNKNTVNDSYTHDLSKLVRTAGLERKLDEEMENPDFAVNWGIVKDWTEASRYEKHTDKEAQALYSAVVHRRQGVLRWIRRHWKKKT